AWLPFEPESTDSLVPERFFPIEGLGSVGLAFRPASKKLSFALAASSGAFTNKARLRLHVADSDINGKLLQPVSFDYGVLSGTPNYRSLDDEGRIRDYKLDLIGWDGYNDEYALIAVKTGLSNPFIFAGLITFILGVILDRAIVLFANLRKYGNETPAQPPTAV
ncbi:MAG: hypothetical protein KTR15_07515, partial [Phycisphaeraceae bacterium]|nr:hypothetical protein [Phycisphaeraceae bacterium]